MNEIRHIIKTARGIEYDISLAAVGSIDGALRIWLYSNNATDVFTVFSNPVETAKLVESNDGIEKTYNGFTAFRGISVNVDGTILVTLNHG